MSTFSECRERQSIVTTRTSVNSNGLPIISDEHAMGVVCVVLECLRKQSNAFENGASPRACGLFCPADVSNGSISRKSLEQI